MRKVINFGVSIRPFLLNRRNHKMPTLGEEPLAKVQKFDHEKSLLRYAKLTENAFQPTRGSKQAAGFDLYRYELIYK